MRKKQKDKEQERDIMIKENIKESMSMVAEKRKEQSRKIIRTVE